MSRSRVVASRPARCLGRQLAQLGCGDFLAFARACLPRFTRLHVRPGVGLSVARISPIVLRPSSRRWKRAVPSTDCPAKR